MSGESAADRKPRILVLGVGNLLLGDEGAGIHVIRRLRSEVRAENVIIVDGGTGGYGLLGYFEDADLAVVVDAALDGNPAGTITRLSPRYARDYPPTLVSHDVGLKDTLAALELLGKKPEVVLFAISIENPGRPTLELSPAVEQSIPQAVRAVVRFLEQAIA
jgi:hydrogenase maturation protease